MKSTIRIDHRKIEKTLQSLRHFHVSHGGVPNRTMASDLPPSRACRTVLDVRGPLRNLRLLSSERRPRITNSKSTYTLVIKENHKLRVSLKSSTTFEQGLRNSSKEEDMVPRHYGSNKIGNLWQMSLFSGDLGRHPRRMDFQKDPTQPIDLEGLRMRLREYTPLYSVGEEPGITTAELHMSLYINELESDLVL